MADKDIAEGQIKQVHGKLQDIAGAVTGDSDTQLKGKTNEAAGKVQEGYGRVKDAVRDALHDNDHAEDFGG